MLLLCAARRNRTRYVKVSHAEKATEPMGCELLIACGWAAVLQAAFIFCVYLLVSST